MSSRLPVLLPLLFFLAVFASPASAQTVSFSLNSSSQLNRSATVQMTISGCSTEGVPAGDWTIDWGDNTTDLTLSSTQIDQPQTHSYANAGAYTITYTYDCTQFGDARTATVSVTFSTDIPASPTAVTIDNPTTTGIAMWTAYSGATAYTLELQVGTTGSVATLKPGAHVSQVNFSSAPNATNCCKNGVDYRARINVSGSKLTSAWSGWASFRFDGTTTFTGTPFSVSISLAYDQSAGALRITTGNSGGTGDPGTNKCKVNDDPEEFDCPAGDVTSRTLPAGATYTVAVAGTRGDEKHSASATIAVPDPEDPEVPVIPPSISNGPRSGRSGAIVTQDSAPAPIPTVDRSRLPAGAEVQSRSPWVSFSEVSGAAISNPAVRNAALSAIDVAGPLGVNAEVCFDGAGSLLLLDTAYSPRRLIWLDAWQRADGKTCAWLDRAGTIALMPAQSPPATQTPQPTATATPNPYLIADSLDLLRTLDNCMVSSVVVLNFRESPAGRILNWYAGVSVALARTPNWFKVSYLGKEGFISAHFVTTIGDCD